ncbi:hypothetical protein LRP88_06336 [Fusarium phalaenopsidis]
MTATLPPNGPLNLDAGLQRSHFQNQETQDSNPPILYGSDGEIEDARLLTPCSPDTPIEKTIFARWCTLGLLDPDLVNDFRAAYLLMMNYGTGMLKPVSDPCGGIFNPDTDWRDFTLPGALRVAAGLPDTGPFVENAIPWVPIGDIEVESGGLIYLDRAHDIGVKYEEDFSKMNADLSDEERMFGNKWSRAWLAGAYEAGDVVFHTPYTIHAGAKNRSPKGRVRVSTDLRFVDKTKPYDERWTFLAYSKNDPNVARKTALRKQA